MYSGREYCVVDLCQICLVASSSYTNCSRMRETNKCNTCFGDWTNIQTTFVNSFIAAATEAQASEHINQSRDYIHLSYGHSMLRAGPASCWHCLRLCCLPLLLPILTVDPSGKLVRESDRFGGMLGFLSVEAYLALRAGDQMKYWYIHIVVMQNQSKFPHTVCTYLFDMIAFVLINRNVQRPHFINIQTPHTVSKCFMLTQLQNKGTDSRRSYISYLVCFFHMKLHKREDGFKCKIIHEVWCKKSIPQSHCSYRFDKQNLRATSLKATEYINMDSAHVS